MVSNECAEEAWTFLADYNPAWSFVQIADRGAGGGRGPDYVSKTQTMEASISPRTDAFPQT